MSTDIGVRATLALPYEQVVQKATDALTAAGFGVLTHIDLLFAYVILATCNPPPAPHAVSSNLDIGSILPCNLTVYEEREGIVVTAADPVEMLGGLKGDPVALELALEARARLQCVIESLM